MEFVSSPMHPWTYTVLTGRNDTSEDRYTPAGRQSSELLNLEAALAIWV